VSQETGRTMSAGEGRSADPNHRIPTQHEPGLPACLVKLSSARRVCNNRKSALPAGSLGSHLPQAVTTKDASRRQLLLGLLAQSVHPRSVTDQCTGCATPAGIAARGVALGPRFKVGRIKSVRRRTVLTLDLGLRSFDSAARLTRSCPLGCNEQILTPHNRKQTRWSSDRFRA
jgi:hypothetical protein